MIIGTVIGYQDSDYNAMPTFLVVADMPFAIRYPKFQYIFYRYKKRPDIRNRKQRVNNEIADIAV